MSKLPSDDERMVLNYLKGKENPFESLVRPQRMDEKFAQLHVPELLSAERQIVLDMIDRFRVAEFNQASDLPPSRVAFVLGDRGSGKTHLLRSLRLAEPDKAYLIRQPEFFEKELKIEEYLLSQLVVALLAEDEIFDGKQIDALAAVFTRRLLRHAILSTTPTERIAFTAPTGLRAWRLLLGSGNPFHASAESLANRLRDASSPHAVRELLQKHGIAPDIAFRLILGHLHRHDKGRDLVSALRRLLYENMARLILFDDPVPLERFLAGEYQQTECIVTPSRVEMTSRILQVLLEGCALARMPVVFAFDNLEQFFSPQGQFDGDLTRAFFNNLAQAVDHTRGMLFLVFAEYGLYESRIGPHLEEYARVRLEQGVLLPGKGPVYEVRLAPPAAETIRAFIAARMKGLLKDTPLPGELSATFPFSQEFLDKRFSEQANLRNVLRALRDEYSRTVYGTGPTVTPTKPDHVPAPPLDMLWHQHRGEAERRLSGSLVPHLKDLHAGLGAIVQKAQPLTLDGWTLNDVQSVVSVGESANYGIVTILSWTRHTDNDNDNGNGNAESMRVAIGLLVAKGPGMAADLSAKFDVFRTRSHKVDRLIVHWCTEKDTSDLVDALPPKTREAWDANRHRARAELRGITLEDLWTLAAFPGWMHAVQEQADPTQAAALIRNFINGNFQDILASTTPSPNREMERSVANAD